MWKLNRAPVTMNNNWWTYNADTGLAPVSWSRASHGSWPHSTDHTTSGADQEPHETLFSQKYYRSRECFVELRGTLEKTDGKQGMPWCLHVIDFHSSHPPSRFTHMQLSFVLLDSQNVVGNGFQEKCHYQSRLDLCGYPLLGPFKHSDKAQPWA